MPSKHVTIVGAGVLGLSAAMHLSAAGRRVVVVDPRTPMSLTSARSTESYRNCMCFLSAHSNRLVLPLQSLTRPKWSSL